jgi:hypothetical protein
MPDNPIDKILANIFKPGASDNITGSKFINTLNPSPVSDKVTMPKKSLPKIPPPPELPKVDLSKNKDILEPPKLPANTEGINLAKQLEAQLGRRPSLTEYQRAYLSMKGYLKFEKPESVNLSPVSAKITGEMPLPETPKLSKWDQLSEDIKSQAKNEWDNTKRYSSATSFKKEYPIIAMSDKYKKEYAEKYWDKTIYTDAVNDYQTVYGKGTTFQEQAGQVLPMVFTPGKYLQSGVKPNLLDIPMTVADVTGFGAIGGDLKGASKLGILGELGQVSKSQAAGMGLSKIGETIGKEAAKPAEQIGQVASDVSKEIKPETSMAKAAESGAGNIPPPPELPGKSLTGGTSGAGGGGNDVIGKIKTMWEEGDKNIKPKITPADIWRKVQVKATDRFVAFNQATSSLKKQLGGKIPEDLNPEVHAALMPGVPEAAVMVAKNTYKTMRGIAGDIPDDMIDAYLTLRHEGEIVKLHPGRALPGGLTTADLTKGMEQLRVQLGDRFPQLEQAANTIREHYKSLLEAHVKSGTVSRKMADEWERDYSWYNPVKYFEHIDDVTAGSQKLNVTSSGIKKLTEFGTEAAQMKPLDVLTQATLQSGSTIARNDSVKSLINNMLQNDKYKGLIHEIKPDSEISKALAEYKPEDQVPGVLRRGQGYKGEPVTKTPSAAEDALNKALEEKHGVLSFMDNGVKRTFVVPKYMEETANYLVVQTGEIEHWMGMVNQISKAGMTGINLAFIAPNAAIDAITALVNQRVMPWQIAKRLALNLKGIVSDNKVMDDLLMAGGGTGFFRGAPDEIARGITKSGNKIIKSEKDLKYFLNPVNWIEELGKAVEMGPRTAAFEKSLAGGKTIKEAAVDARRVTVDFSRYGTVAKQLNYAYIYLNAGFQGTLLPIRALRDTSWARWAVTGLAATAVANYAWNRRFKEYQDVPDYAKYGSFIWMLPSNEYDERGNKVPHYVAMIPNMREWSLFTGPIIYILRKLDDKAPEDVSQFLKGLLPNINPLSQISESSGSIQTPTQFLSTYNDITHNTDSYRGYPIVPVELQGVAPEKQYNQYTSATAIKMGELLNQSPMKIDYAVKNIFGGLGQQIMSAADKVVNWISPPDVPQRLLDIVDQLKKVQKTAAPEDIASKRNELLYSLSNEDRNTVLDLERRPADQIPVITPILRRIYREQGGQLYKTGQAMGSKELAKLTGMSANAIEAQTKNASKILGEAGDKLNLEQEKSDKSLLNGDITPAEWRDARSTQSDVYRGILMAVGIQYPQAAQVGDYDTWNKYLDSVYTLAAAMPDTRGRAEILKSGYQAIRPEETAPGKIDWDTFYKQRDDFMSNLIPEDKKLLESELKARMTPIEKSYFDFTQSDKLNSYFKFDEGKSRDLYRSQNPDLDAFLNLWGYVTTLKTEKALELLKKDAASIGLDYKILPYFQEQSKNGSGVLPSSGKIKLKSQ